MGWRGFAAWAVAGGLLAFSFLSWVGFFLLPVALVACWFAARSAARPSKCSAPLPVSASSVSGPPARP